MSLPKNIFCAYPDGIIYRDKGNEASTKGKHPLTQLLWGDHICNNGIEGEWVKVNSRGKDGWMHRTKVQKERILEVNFVDVGQGDGVHVVTPDDKAIVIDAGEKDNMYRFLRWRYSKNKKFKKEVGLYAAVITHPDKDHYNGFSSVVNEKYLTFDHFFHNGLVERKLGNGKKGLQRLGKTKKGYSHEVIKNNADLKILLDKLESDGLVTGSLYTKLLYKAYTSGHYPNIHFLGKYYKDKEIPFFPGFEKNTNPDCYIEVLGPIFEGSKDKPKFKTFNGSLGKTKNGHSIILKVHIGDIKILLGGDLNIPAEQYLLSHYTQMDKNPETTGEEEKMISRARYFFESDFAKACHHGSSDFTETFLKSINARATVVSSGDNEPHCHPRPDTLGALGKYGRGHRPLIFSTELARSYDTKILNPYQLYSEMEKQKKKINSKRTSDKGKKEAQKLLNESKKLLGSSIARYGMICLRTDGKKAIMAQKLERYRGNSKKWSISKFIRDDITGELIYDSPH